MMHWLSLLTICSALPALAAESFLPGFRINSGDYTVLMTADATMPPGLKPFQGGVHGKLHVAGWGQPTQRMQWDITVQKACSRLPRLRCSGRLDRL